MKRAGFLIWTVIALAACNNSATVENKADTAGRESDTVSRQMWDSGKQDVDELKHRIQDQFEDSSIN